MSKYDTSIKIKVIKEYKKILANLYYQKNIRYHKQLFQIG